MNLGTSAPVSSPDNHEHANPTFQVIRPVIQATFHGRLNRHVDDPSDPVVPKFLDLFNKFILRQLLFKRRPN